MNRNAFQNLILKYESDIYGICYHLTMHQDLADDLYQDTISKAFELIDKIDVNYNPKSFILSVAYRLWKNKKKKIARHEKITSSDTYNVWYYVNKKYKLNLKNFSYYLYNFFAILCYFLTFLLSNILVNIYTIIF